jgi:lipopolysaccharide transport system ATP-binding protein
MSQCAIEVANLGKQYLIPKAGSAARGGSFRSLMPRWRSEETQELWALKDVSFNIGRGEAIGIVGRNGAGKSTLLKLLSRITRPTEGRASIRGRVGTLLEVGTGFHPELTGRDNIFLSGTILGMSRAEIARKFDQIVAFSEIEDFVDTPVKRYSSGMYVRLAFAVASFLEPEILILDEVLAVGDAGFQRKSLGRLNEASEQEGKTVLFVSHNLQTVRTFCKRVIVLEKGRLAFDGATDDGIERYLRMIPTTVDVRGKMLKDRLNRTNGAIRFTKVTALNSAGETTWRVQQRDTVRLRCSYEVLEAVPDLMFLVQFRSMTDGQLISTIRSPVTSKPIERGRRGIIEIELPNLALRPGEFSLCLCLGRLDDAVYYDVLDANVDLPFLAVTSPSTDKYERQGVVSLDYRLNIVPEEAEAVP